jgi:hypothetical protein
VWVKNLLIELGIQLSPILLYGDNQGSIFLASNPVQEKCINVTIHNHAYQKLFPFIIACPNSLLPLSTPLLCLQETPLHIHDWHIIKLHIPGLSPSNRHIIKLHFPILEPIIRYDVKLQPRPDLA